MTEPFLCEIRIMTFAFAPRGWALCDGQILPVNQNQSLFSLLQSRFGGDGRVNFALPNLQGRVPIHVGPGHTLGESGGEPGHTLSAGEVPEHSHALNATTASGNVPVPTNDILALSPSNLYAGPTSLTTLDLSSVSNAGGGQPHQNLQPYLTLNFCIALQGIVPNRG
jgi:microcystin-dependent protein